MPREFIRVADDAADDDDDCTRAWKTEVAVSLAQQTDRQAAADVLLRLASESSARAFVVAAGAAAGSIDSL